MGPLRLLPYQIKSRGPGYLTVGVFTASRLTRSRYGLLAAISFDPSIGNLYVEFLTKKMFRLLPLLRSMRLSYPRRFRVYLSVFHAGLINFSILLSNGSIYD